LTSEEEAGRERRRRAEIMPTHKADWGEPDILVVL
jgi:hypothetical protein